MKRLLSLPVWVSIILVSACGVAENKINPLAGRVFREINEIPGLKEYANGGGSVIDESIDAGGNFTYGIGYYYNDKNTVCIFSEISKPDANGKVSYTILDTINIGPLSNSNALNLCRCRRDTIHDCKIIATYIEEDKPYFNRIVKAWRVNLTTKKIERLTDTRGIDCVNEAFGEGEEDATGEINPADTTGSLLQSREPTDSGTIQQ